MRETSMYYYQEPFIEVIARIVRKLEKILPVVTVSFVFITLLVVEFGSLDIERWELWLNSRITIETIPIEYQEVHTEETQKTTTEEITDQTNEYAAISENEVAETTEEVEVTEVMYVTANANYNPTEAERVYAYKVAFGEASNQGSMGQTLVINVAINNMRKNGDSSLIQEFERSGRYSCVENGEVYNSGKVVEVSDVPQSVKDAVDAAFDYDYSEQLLKAEADQLGITDESYWMGGATYFYNPNLCSDNQNNLRQNIKVRFEYGNHIFYRYWDK